MGAELTPRQKEQLAKLDDTITDYELVFREALPPGVRVERFLQDARNALANNPDLANVYAPSVIGGLVTCAQLNLRPHVPALGHAWLIPMKNKNADYRLDATLIVGYKGFTDIGYRDPATTLMGAYVVKEGDAFESWFDGEWHVRYKPNRRDPRRDERPTVDYFAMAKYRGELHVTEPMTHAQMVRHRNKHALTKSGGPWYQHGEFSPEFDEQGKKTMIRARLVKLLPQTIDLVTAAYADEGTRTDDDPHADIMQVTVHPGRDDDDGDAADENGGGQEQAPRPRSVIRLIAERVDGPAADQGTDEPTKAELLDALGSALTAKGVTGPAMLAYASRVLERQVNHPKELNRDEIAKVQDAVTKGLFLNGKTADAPAPQAPPAAENPPQETAQPPAAEPVPEPAHEAEPAPAPAAPEQPQGRPIGGANRATLTKLNTVFGEAGITGNDRFLWLLNNCNVQVTSTAQLTAAKADEAIAKLDRLAQARCEDLKLRIVTVWTDLGGTKDELTPAVCLWVNSNTRRRSKQPVTKLAEVSNVHLDGFLKALSADPGKGQVTPEMYRQAVAAQAQAASQ
ncbi:recombinase RecT [Nonomuraea sp. SYSU D8015]|uniref:recombinase RecT n=1 Tax=Nonomuraea sp. SYSU D8015 TaxID=2593644 RepID=UPI0016607FA8|nr:recombinase RecT [Nonomuraea sp. SYSU D8015]